MDFNFTLNFNKTQGDEKEAQIKEEVQEIKNLSARIEKVSALGNLTVTFNASILPLKESELNNKTFSVSLVPSNSQVSPKLLNNFKWTVNSFTDTGFKLFLNFSDPFVVSSGEIHDRVVIKFKRPELFFSKELNRSLHEDWFEISRQIPRQIPFNKGTQSVMEKAD